jgi:hypothetical protein
MASADFWTFSHTLLYGLLWFLHLARIVQTSPGKSRQPSFHVAAAFTLQGSGSKARGLADSPAFWDFVLFWKLIRLAFALYAVSVRRLGTLPPASFRFHLAMDTLAFG